MTYNGEIVEKRAYPSPNPAIRLTEITYLSQGLRIKGLLAEPKKEGTYDGFLYLRGGMQSIDGKTLSYCTICCAGLYRICPPILSWESWRRGT